jgi:hypothetical protein
MEMPAFRKEYVIIPAIVIIAIIIIFLFGPAFGAKTVNARLESGTLQFSKSTRLFVDVTNTLDKPATITVTAVGSNQNILNISPQTSVTDASVGKGDTRKFEFVVNAILFDGSLEGVYHLEITVKLDGTTEKVSLPIEIKK